jgi:ribonuclease R
MLLLRSLAKADYRPENEGHFGLASEHYLHFTAPIRRYADLIVHRSLKASFAKTRLGITNQQLSEIASHISDTERIAVAAERDTVDQKAAEYYQDKIGEEYEGTVSGFSKSALFVQLENTVEGAIFYRTLDGYFQYNEERLSAENGRGNTIHIGDAVTVRVASVDINRRFLDFALVRHSEARSKEEAKSIPQKSREKEAKRLSKMHKRQDKRRSR